LKNVGETAFSGRPTFSAASLTSTWHKTLSRAYTETLAKPLTLFTVNPYWVFRKLNADSTNGLL
jgi:FPC/CPF motif-containing protein YcgG